MRSVSFIRPRIDDYATALDAYRRGEFGDAILALGGQGDPSARALLARCYIRENRIEQVLAVLDDSEIEAVDEAHAAEFLALRATVKYRLRDFVGSQADLTSARVFGLSSNLVALQSEIEYFSSVLCYAQGDLDGASAAARRALRTEYISRSWVREDDSAGYPHTLQLSEARALEMLGFVAAGRIDHRKQIELLREANDRFDVGATKDTFVEASLIHNYALIAKDLDNLADVDYLHRKVSSIQWTETTRTFEFYTRHSLGWFNASSGNYLDALREFRLAAHVAPTIPLRILAITDRAFLANELDEAFSAREDLESAVELCRAVDWEAKTGEERYALFFLAEQLAPFAATKARELLDLYFGLKTPLAVLVAGHHDRRLRGYECLAVSAVLSAEGHRQRATINALEAFNIFDSLQFSLRAARIALRLTELTGELKYRAYVERVAAERPNSWLMRRFRAMSVA